MAERLEMIGVALTQEELPEVRRRSDCLSRMAIGAGFYHGVSFDSYLHVFPLADIEDYLNMGMEEAEEILQLLWSEHFFGSLGDRRLAIDAFVFGCVYGFDVAIWLLQETATLEKVDRSYAMREPERGLVIDRRMVAKLAERSEALKMFRMLTAGYVGWLNRVPV